MSWSHLEKNFAKADLESCSTEVSREDRKEQVLIAVHESNAIHTQEDSESISKTKMIETLTSHIKEVLLHFLPESSISREYITSMHPEDILFMFKLKENFEKNKKVAALYIDEYFLQHEQQLSQKLQSVQQHGFQTVHAIETKINLCEIQIKAAEEKLERLRRKVARLLLKIHPHLLINELDIDGFLEESLNSENMCTFATEKASTTETNVSVFPDEDTEEKLYNSTNK